MELQDYIDANLVHEIHTSERRSFRSCRRRWDWVSRQRYYPKVTAKPLEFGVAYHKGMEVYYDPKTWDQDREVTAAEAVMAFTKVCEEQRQEVEQTQGYLDDEQREDYEERVELGRNMLNYYFAKVAPKEDVGWKPYAVEIKFMIPIPNPETGEEAIWCKCDECWDKYRKFHGINDIQSHDFYELSRDAFKGIPVVYAGRLDMLAVDDYGQYWVVDWKTAAQVRDSHEFLELDDQVASYCWALIRMGWNVRGFIYHEQKKAYPTTPKKNKQVRMGRMFSVSKSEPYEYNSYLETVKEYDTKAYEAGLYDEYLEFLRNEGPVFYARYQIYKTPDEIDSTEYNIGQEALDMIDPALRVYPAPGRFGCSFCAYRVPCLEQNAKGDYTYALETLFEKKEHYYIRQEASTESKGAE